MNFFLINHKYSKIGILIILFFIYLSICAFNYVEAVSYDISNSVFRLHVIANSNNEKDQNLKYKVRDNLLNYMNNLCSNCTSKEESIKIVTEHLSDFQNIAKNTVNSEGFSYNINLEITNSYFPTKQYGDISLPSGNYDCLKVKIGNASGKNWWCVMFPSLCFVDISNGIVPEDSKSDLKELLTPEEYSLISNNNKTAIKLKFKLIEFFKNNKYLTAKN